MYTRPSNYDLIKLGLIDHPFFDHKLTLDANPGCEVNRGYIEVTAGVSPINQTYEVKFSAHPYPDRSIIDDAICYQHKLNLSKENIDLLLQEIKYQLKAYIPSEDYFSKYRVFVFDQDTGCKIYEKISSGLCLTEDILMTQFSIMKNCLMEYINQPTSNLGFGCNIF